jgi:hypothetical protein
MPCPERQDRVNSWRGLFSTTEDAHRIMLTSSTIILSFRHVRSLRASQVRSESERALCEICELLLPLHFTFRDQPVLMRLQLATLKVSLTVITITAHRAKVI